MNNSIFQIYPSSHHWIEESAAFIFQHAQLNVIEKGRFSLCLAGGSTPQKVYERLAQSPYDQAFPWSKTFVFWGDERSVSLDHQDSNYRMARVALLDHVDLPSNQIFPIKDADDPERAAFNYQETLKGFFGDLSFDLTLLGLGNDGHTASLFPGTSVLTSDQMVAALHVPKLDTHRISLTIHMINSSKDIAYLVMGSKKAAIVKDMLGPQKEIASFPAQMIEPSDGNLYWLLDLAAAEHLIQVSKGN